MKILLYKNDCEDMNIEKVDNFFFVKVSKMVEFDVCSLGYVVLV